MHQRWLTIFFGVFCGSLAQAAETSWLGVRVDCLHNFNIDKGSTQPCLEVSGLRLGLTHQAAPDVRATLQLDPFTTPWSAKADTPLRSGLPGPDDTALGIVDDYALIWAARPSLEIAAGAYRGAARLPSVSGLALANSFADTGWRQTALTITYNLTVPTAVRVRFAAGDGEGETVRNLDPQQYFGFEADAVIVKGLHAVVGVSLDGNSGGSEAYQFEIKRYAEGCGVGGDLTTKVGHSTQRLAAGVVVDGSLAGAEGLKAALGWQRNVASDLDKKTRSVPAIDELEFAKCRLDADTVFAENSEGLNSVQHTTYGVSVAYRLLGAYFIGLDYTTRRVDTGSEKMFRVCKRYSGKDCAEPSDERDNALSQDAFTVGAGMDLAQGLRLSIEYFKTAYDRSYTQLYYDAPNGRAANSLDAFNARLAYNWQ